MPDYVYALATSSTASIEQILLVATWNLVVKE